MNLNNVGKKKFQFILELFINFPCEIDDEKNTFFEILQNCFIIIYVSDLHRYNKYIAMF